MSRKSSATFWQKSKTSSKAGFDRLWGYADKLGDPVNKLSHKLGSEAFWPTTLDKESEKAARILRSFCKDGFYDEEIMKTPDGPEAKQRVLKRIPAEVIKQAKGLAIFTTMRTGLWVSGAGGSGILVGRMPDGKWSPPVGIMLHTAGLGFLVGVDIYDCVLVLNTDQALNAFSKWRCTIGGEISAVAGPAGIGGMLETEMHKRQAPVFTYLKSRGFYAGVQIDGTVVIERSDENERFYNQKISAKDILAGKAQTREWELRMLIETLKAAQGDRGIDYNLVPSDPPPADYEVVEEGHVFGVPDKEDPDPYGVLALEKEGLLIKEAATHTPVSTEEFEFRPSLTSPIYDSFRKSFESGMSRSASWRGSQMSMSTTQTARERRYVTSDMSTQTDFEPPPTSPLLSPSQNKASSPQKRSLTNGAIVQTKEELREESLSKLQEPAIVEKTTNGESSVEPDKEDDKESLVARNNVNGNATDEQDDVAVIQEVKQAPQIAQKARMIAVPKRIPPKLPPRNPQRARSSNNVLLNGASTQTSHSRSGSHASVDGSVQSSSERRTSIHSSKSSISLAECAVEDRAVAPNPGDGTAAIKMDEALQETAMATSNAPSNIRQMKTVQPVEIVDDESVSEGSFSGSEGSPAIIATAATASSLKMMDPVPTDEPSVAGASPSDLDGHHRPGTISTSEHILPPPILPEPTLSEKQPGTHSSRTSSPLRPLSFQPVKRSASPLPSPPFHDTNEQGEDDTLPGAFATDGIPVKPPTLSPQPTSRPEDNSPLRGRISIAGIRGGLQTDVDDDDDDERSRSPTKKGNEVEEEDFS